MTMPPIEAAYSFLSSFSARLIQVCAMLSRIARSSAFWILEAAAKHSSACCRYSFALLVTVGERATQWVGSALLWIFGCQQPLFGTPRQFFIVFGDPKHFALCIRIGHFLCDGASPFAAIAPMLRIVDGDFGHSRTLRRRLF
jgi:hypothetical protein